MISKLFNHFNLTIKPILFFGVQFLVLKLLLELCLKKICIQILKTKEGKQFPAQFNVSQTNSAPTALYIAGLGGKGNQVSSISKFFNQNGINLVTFDRNEKECKGFTCFKTVGQRSKSVQLIYAENNRETAI